MEPYEHILQLTSIENLQILYVDKRKRTQQALSLAKPLSLTPNPEHQAKFCSTLCSVVLANRGALAFQQSAKELAFKWGI